MHGQAGDAHRVVEAVGEPPAAVPAARAVRVGRQVVVDVDGREERVVQTQHGAAVGELVHLLGDDELVVVEFVGDAELVVPEE